MTYEAARTNLLASAGREKATELLPKPFELWYSAHDTGTQMTIVLPVPGQSSVYVWRGSIWHSSRYEFNDQGDTPGLQPDFEFAKPAIEKYFTDAALYVERRNADYRAANEASKMAETTKRNQAIAAARAALTH